MPHQRTGVNAKWGESVVDSQAMPILHILTMFIFNMGLDTCQARLANPLHDASWEQKGQKAIKDQRSSNDFFFSIAKSKELSGLREGV